MERKTGLSIHHESLPDREANLIPGVGNRFSGPLRWNAGRRG